MQEVETQRAEAEATLQRETQPLARLIAEADELAARALVGDAEEEDAQQAEAEVRDARQRVDDARRTVQQCDRAEERVLQKLRRRARELHKENAEAVRSVHRVLLHRALEAERRAATLLRVLREFEQRYARYSTDEASAQHPQYLTERDRTMPPRALMGPARIGETTSFDRSEASVWMHRTANHLEADRPMLLDVESLDFEDPQSTPKYVAPEEDVVDPSSLPDPGEPSATDEDAREEPTSPAPSAAADEAIADEEDDSSPHEEAEDIGEDAAEAPSETADLATTDAEDDADEETASAA